MHGRLLGATDRGYLTVFRHPGYPTSTTAGVWTGFPITGAGGRIC